MKTSSVIQDASAPQRPPKLALSRLAVEALIGEGEDAGAQAGSRLTSAVLFYLRDRNAGRPAWPYPSFLRRSEVQEDVEVPLDLDEGLWRSFAAEAGVQDVSPQQLAEHTAFYLAAEIDAGRVTQRILDDLAQGEDGDREPGSPPAS